MTRKKKNPKSSFSPAPWRFHKLQDTREGELLDENMNPVCFLPQGEHQAANARLLEAAPLMLGMLTEICTGCDYYSKRADNECGACGIRQLLKDINEGE